MLRPFQRDPSEVYSRRAEIEAFFSDWYEVNRMRHLKTIVDLDENGCKWPVTQSKEGIHLFCNEQRRENSSYCQEHHEKAHTTVERKR